MPLVLKTLKTFSWQRQDIAIIAYIPLYPHAPDTPLRYACDSSGLRPPPPPQGEGKIGLRGGGGGGAPRRRGGGSGNGAPVTEPLVKYHSPRREVVRSSAGAGVVYPPLFGGHSRSIPQGMILVVRRLQAVGMPVAIATNHGRMVTQSTVYFLDSSSNPRWSTAIGGAAAMSA